MNKSFRLFMATITILFIALCSLQTVYDARIIQLQPPTKNHHFVIVVCSYNNIHVYQKNLDSIFAQDYPFYHIVYLDDHSPDGTFDAVSDYIKSHQLTDKITLIHNPVNTRQLRNTYYAVHNFSADDDIIIILDGDDWFAHPQVLSVLNTFYQDPNVWMTCGNYIQDKGYLLVPNYTPPHSYDRATLRTTYNTPPPHLRSFYSWLFKQIPLEDLMSEGAFIPMAADMAYLFPMLEMAQDHYLPVQQALYIYNTTGALNCYHNQKSKDLQIKYAHIIQQKKPYALVPEPIATTYTVIEPQQKTLFNAAQLEQFNKVMNDTHAAVFTIAHITGTHDQKIAHSTYLYDNYWTYQLGYLPELPYTFEILGHTLHPRYAHDNQLRELVATESNALPITENELLQNKVGILWLQSTLNPTHN